MTQIGCCAAMVFISVTNQCSICCCTVILYVVDYTLRIVVPRSPVYIVAISLCFIPLYQSYRNTQKAKWRNTEKRKKGKKVVQVDLVRIVRAFLDCNAIRGLFRRYNLYKQQTTDRGRQQWQRDGQNKRYTGYFAIYMWHTIYRYRVGQKQP